MGNSQTSNSKTELPLLPTEVWIKIWSFLDFNTLQKVCTRVSTKWFWDIRNSALLSGEMKLKRTIYNKKGKIKNLSDEDFNTLLSHWLKLKTLYLNGQESTEKIKSDILSKKINFKANTLLERIVVDETFYRGLDQDEALKEFGNDKFSRRITVQQIWIDPKTVKANDAPFNLENILYITINGSLKNENLKKIGSMLINLETLEIVDANDTLDFEWISSFQNLKTLKIVQELFDENHLVANINYENLKKITALKNLQLSCGLTGDIFQLLNKLQPGLKLSLRDCTLCYNISSLLDILNCLGKVKNLQIQSSIRFFLENDLEEEVAKDLVEKAKNIINLNIIDQTRYWYVCKGDFWAPYYELIYIDSTRSINDVADFWPFWPPYTIRGFGIFDPEIV